ncbi:hypothetical protein NDU88_005009 [Pleurodeles waltl]|uniref:Uncharacterized protein n=1 Tax=Pleurodeles waltl TaxID=8319 RepID=A0AAV7TB98_PLEWA|nr:hypothetical protein NDU88_005009 [Pleurodeles waltl]
MQRDHNNTFTAPCPLETQRSRGARTGGAWIPQKLDRTHSQDGGEDRDCLLHPWRAEASRGSDVLRNSSGEEIEGARRRDSVQGSPKRWLKAAVAEYEEGAPAATGLPPGLERLTRPAAWVRRWRPRAWRLVPCRISRGPLGLDQPGALGSPAFPPPQKRRPLDFLVSSAGPVGERWAFLIGLPGLSTGAAWVRAAAPDPGTGPAPRRR